MIPSCHLARSLEGVQTELIIQTFADRILLLITQVGKVGNLVRRHRILVGHPLTRVSQIQASIPPTAPLLPASTLNSNTDTEERSDAASEPNHSLPSPPPSIQLTPLLGSGSTEDIRTLHSLYTSQTATLVWLSVEKHGGERKPVVVGIALKKADVWDEAKERKTFMGVMEMLNELLESRSHKDALEQGG